MATQKRINEIKDVAVKEAKKVLCSDILKSAGIPTRKRGVQLYAPCPKCGKPGDVKMDKFSVNTDANLFHCFGCGFGGSSINLYGEYYGLSYIESALNLAYKSGGISEEDYNYALSSPDARAKLKKDEAVYKAVEAKEGEDFEKKAPAEVVDLVYRHLLSMSEFRLSDVHYKYLLTERHLSDREIKENGFFSYSKGFSIEKLMKEIRKEKADFNYDSLNGVPGFFFVYSDQTKASGCWAFKNPMADCLGIPLKNCYSQIVALQMRYLGNKPHQNKYFYISSKNAVVKGRETGFGSSCGSPVAVCYPEKITNSIFYVGEGFFKMKEIAKEGSVAFSCQGVQTFHYVVDEAKLAMTAPILLDRAKTMNGERTVKFCIVYDADMYDKVQVLDAAIKTIQYIKKSYPDKKIYVLVWDPAFGKGFDDMKFYCQKNGIEYHSVTKAINSELFISFAKESFSIADREYLASEEHKNDGLDDNSLLLRREPLWGQILKRELFYNRLSRFLK